MVVVLGYDLNEISHDFETRGYVWDLRFHKMGIELIDIDEHRITYAFDHRIDIDSYGFRHWSSHFRLLAKRSFNFALSAERATTE